MLKLPNSVHHAWVEFSHEGSANQAEVGHLPPRVFWLWSAFWSRV